MMGRFIAVVGPSGVGKDSVMTGMVAHNPNLHLVRRVITRPEGAGGEDFEGASEADFAKMRAQGCFALSWQAHGLHYGIPMGVDDDLREGQDLLANLSRSVLEEAASRFSRFLVISLTARPEVLSLRLRARGREDAAEVARRLDRAGLKLPASIRPIRIDNSRSLDQTVETALSCLYPVSV